MCRNNESVFLHSLFFHFDNNPLLHGVHGATYRAGCDFQLKPISICIDDFYFFNNCNKQRDKHGHAQTCNCLLHCKLCSFF